MIPSLVYGSGRYDAAGDKISTSGSVVAALPVPAQDGSAAAAKRPRQDRKSGNQEAAAQARRPPHLTAPKQAAPEQVRPLGKPAVEANASTRQTQQRAPPKKATVQQKGPQLAEENAGRRPLTKPRSPKLGTSTRRQLTAGLTGRSIAKQLDQACTHLHITTPPRNHP